MSYLNTNELCELFNWKIGTYYDRIRDAHIKPIKKHGKSYFTDEHIFRLVKLEEWHKEGNTYKSFYGSWARRKQTKTPNDPGYSVTLALPPSIEAPDEAPPASPALEETTEPLTAPLNDAVNHPLHYTAGSVECIDALRATLGISGFIGYCTGNSIKYLWRFQQKNGKEDVSKALWYCQKLLEVLDEALVIS